MHFKISLHSSALCWHAREGRIAQELAPRVVELTTALLPTRTIRTLPLHRTKNPKKSSHMPLSGLCASRGRRGCPELLRAPTDDRCFALMQADSLADEQGGGQRENIDGNETDGGRDSPAPGRRKWGIGGTLPANLVHGKRWRGGVEGGVGVATTGGISASSTPGGPTAATRRAVNRRPNAGARERMGLETTSAEECTALVDEINELVRRAGLKHGGGGSSSRGRDLFDEWVRSAETRRTSDADADAKVATRSAEATRSTPNDTPIVNLD